MIVDKIKKHWWKYVIQGTAIAAGIAIITPLYDFLPLGIDIGPFKISLWWFLIAGAVAFIVDYAFDYFKIQPR